MNSNIKRLIKIAITIIMGVSLIILMIVTSSLSSQIKSLKEELAILRNEIPSSVNVTTTMEERKALFEKIEHSYGAVNYDTNTIAYHLKVLPTTITDDMKISFVLNDKEYEMTKNGNYYETTLHLGLFDQNDDEYFQDYFMVVQDDEKYIQRYDDIVTNLLFNYCTERMIVGYRALSSSESNGKMTINYIPTISSVKNSFVVNHEDIVDIVKVEMITEINGKIVEREDVTKELNKSNTAVIQPMTRKTYDGSFDKDTVHIYCEATDENGYVQKDTLVIRSPDNAEKVYFDTIYDANGNLLYAGDYHQ